MHLYVSFSVSCVESSESTYKLIYTIQGRKLNTLIYIYIIGLHFIMSSKTSSKKDGQDVTRFLSYEEYLDSHIRTVDEFYLGDKE